MPKVIVVGGGFAGVAAATALAEKGVEVELLESRGFLGGRVYSSQNDSFPGPVDNGPHLFMGCYEETWKFFRRLKITDHFHYLDPLSLTWLTTDKKKVTLQCGRLPAPLHLVWGLLTTNAFGWGEKIALARSLSYFSKKPFHLPLEIRTVEDFMLHTQQGPQSIERFWIPLCNAVMNVPVDTAPIQGLGEVLHRIFFGKRFDSALVVAKEPLSDMGFKDVAEYMEDHRGMVHFHEGIQKFEVKDGAFELTGRSGQVHQGDALVWAVPPTSLSALWPADNWDRIAALPQLGKSPILSVHLIVSKTLFTEHLVGLSGGRFEWVFNRDANWGSRFAGQYLSLVASAADNLARLTEKELVDMAVEELKDRLPADLEWDVLKAKVTREMAATFIWNQETDSLRLPCETPYPQVFLAGDWTDTGLPATMEGACLSGHKAAERVMAYLKIDGTKA